MSNLHQSSRAHEALVAGHGVLTSGSPTPGDDTLKGTGGNDRLYGQEGDDVLKAGKGDDYLLGGDGADRMYGGAGNDRITDDQPANDSAYGGAGTDQIDFFNCQDGVIFASGGPGDDTIRVDGHETYGPYRGTNFKVFGGDGRDHIEIGAGRHAVVDAGAGDDVVTIDDGFSARERVTLGTGADTLHADGGNYFDLDFTVTDFSAAQHDRLDIEGYQTSPYVNGALRVGQIGNDTVVQADATRKMDWHTTVTLLDVDARTLKTENFSDRNGAVVDPGPLWRIGLDGADSLHASVAFEHLDGGAGDDQLKGDAATNSLLGGTGDDDLDGQDGADLLAGGVGQDVLAGGAGADVFAFNTVADSTVAASDLIKDLTAEDRIDLSRIDASATQSGDQAFTVVGAFSGAEGQLVVTYDAAQKLTVVSGDVNGDSQADFMLTARGDHTADIHFVL